MEKAEQVHHGKIEFPSSLVTFNYISKGLMMTKLVIACYLLKWLSCVIHLYMMKKILHLDFEAPVLDSGCSCPFDHCCAKNQEQETGTSPHTCCMDWHTILSTILI